MTKCHDLESNCGKTFTLVFFFAKRQSLLDYWDRNTLHILLLYHIILYSLFNSRISFVTTSDYFCGHLSLVGVLSSYSANMNVSTNNGTQKDKLDEFERNRDAATLDINMDEDEDTIAAGNAKG